MSPFPKTVHFINYIIQRTASFKLLLMCFFFKQLPVVLLKSKFLSKTSYHGLTLLGLFHHQSQISLMLDILGIIFVFPHICIPHKFFVRDKLFLVSSVVKISGRKEGKMSTRHLCLHINPAQHYRSTKNLTLKRDKSTLLNFYKIYTNFLSRLIPEVY
jgi:hypothetical protein